MKIYVETSSLLYLIDDNEPYKKDRTIEMYEQLAQIDAELSISSIVHIELLHSPPVIGRCVSAIMEKKKISILPLEERHIELAQKLMDNRITPEQSFLESVHIATAFLAACDLLISWDFEYILKGDVMARLKMLAREWELNPTVIGSPELFLKAGYGNPRTLEKLRSSRARLTELQERKSPPEMMKIMERLVHEGLLTHPG